MSQDDVYRLLKKDRQLTTDELVKRLKKKCKRTSIVRALRVMKDHKEVIQINCGRRNVHRWEINEK